MKVKKCADILITKMKIILPILKLRLYKMVKIEPSVAVEVKELLFDLMNMTRVDIKYDLAQAGGRQQGDHLFTDS